MINSAIKIQNGVYIASSIDKSFNSPYLKVRELEQRVYSDEIVCKLPRLSNNHPQYNEWKLRQKSTDRFLDYLKRNKKESILEIGCGNGWFINSCSNFTHKAIGVDINILELEQAARLFSKPNFIYWDLFSESPFNQKFDLIVLNASVQYFPDFQKLKNRLLELISKDGEIHIIDSPFYSGNGIIKAKKRTEDYYNRIGVIEMANNYYHHSSNDLKEFEELYTPESSQIKKIFKSKDVPFGWYKFKL